MSKTRKTTNQVFRSYDEYQNQFFPKDSKEELLQTKNSFELGTKLAERALMELNNALINVIEQEK